MSDHVELTLHEVFPEEYDSTGNHVSSSGPPPLTPTEQRVVDIAHRAYRLASEEAERLTNATVEQRKQFRESRFQQIYTVQMTALDEECGQRLREMHADGRHREVVAAIDQLAHTIEHNNPINQAIGFIDRHPILAGMIGGHLIRRFIK